MNITSQSGELRQPPQDMGHFSICHVVSCSESQALIKPKPYTALLPVPQTLKHCTAVHTTLTICLSQRMHSCPFCERMYAYICLVFALGTLQALRPGMCIPTGIDPPRSFSPQPHPKGTWVIIGTSQQLLSNQFCNTPRLYFHREIPR